MVCVAGVALNSVESVAGEGLGSVIGNKEWDLESMVSIAVEG